VAGCAVAVLGLILAAAPPPREADAAAEPEAPSAELLLYLAEFADADGQLIDPAELPEKTDSAKRDPEPRRPEPPKKAPSRDPH
jgi:hypothetical protein